MRSVIAGIAGHIDHGKTALVRALTGIDTDRLEEEKLRGISIDIGFAHQNLASDVRVAFIDVPGHEKFIKNMLAGVAGIDFVVLTVASNESIKPQTREHFDICKLLGIRSGVVALTKSDLVDADTAGVVRLEIEDFVKDSFLENASIIPVSALTGVGLDELRLDLERLARVSIQRDSSQYFRLPLDRSFSMPGFGTVVTGTVFSGSVKLDEEVEVYPGGRILRVRGIQVHGQDVEIAVAGQRAALNVTGAAQGDLCRGLTLGPKGTFAATSVFDAMLELLPTAKPLKNRAPIHFHQGTAEVPAEVRTLDKAAFVEPGGKALVRIVLREPSFLLPGDRFVVRMFSPVTTIGGGEILDILPPRRLSMEHARVFVGSALAKHISFLVSEAPEGLSISSLVARLGLRPERIVDAMPQEIHRFNDWLMHEAAIKDRLAGWKRRLEKFHHENPLVPGYNREEFRARALPNAPVYVYEALLAKEKEITAAREFVRLATHKIALQNDERQASESIEKAFEKAGLQAPSVSEVLASSGIDPARAHSLLKILLRERRLIRFSDHFVLHSSAVQALKQLFATRKGERFSVGDFKDWTGVSRKYAIPLLEWLDREHITARIGDFRTVL